MSLWTPQGEPITFCEESFVNHRSSTMRNFLSIAVNLQLFKQVQTAVCTRHVCDCVCQSFYESALKYVTGKLI